MEQEPVGAESGAVSSPGVESIEHALMRDDELERSDELRFMLENSADVIFHSSDGTLKWVSPSAAEVLGMTPDELIGTTTVQYWHPDDREAAIALREAAHDGRVGRATLRWRRPDGEYVWVDAIVRPVEEPDGTVGMVGSIRDISDRVLAQQELARVMGHDALTGLATRSAILTQLANLLAGLTGAHRHIAVLCVGVDRLSAVNDAYGHAAGDLALVTFARRIVEIVHDVGLVARGSGVDFLVIAQMSDEDMNEVAGLAERIRKSVRDDMKLDGHEVQVTASIGVSIGESASDPVAVVEAATIAMESAKDAGRDRVVFSAPELAAKARHRAALLERAREGVRRGDFVPVYMPIAELESSRMRGYEALARWRRPDGTVWEAAVFLKALESTQLICDLDISILRRALSELQHTPAGMFMSVNVSARTLSTPRFSDELYDVVSSASKLRGPLHLEVSESILLDVTPDVIGSMIRLADAGVCWYVDNFGIGYSSISHLRELPITGLKLDISLTRGIGRDDETSNRVSQAIAGLAQGLNLDTIAVGVEDARQASLFAEQGWHLGQGALYGSAVTMAEGP